MNSNPLKRPALALVPIIVFLILYLVSSVIAGDFYKMPVPVSFLVASVVALGMNTKRKFRERIETYLKGMGNSGIMMMCLIFILAGVFASLAKAMGAVDATVNIGINLLPANILIAGVFVIGCFISLSVGTSLGTVVALTPVAMGIAEQTGVSAGLVLGAVIGGAMFGDNLSFISDTTIAAARTQGCRMKDKFKVNFIIVFPAAVLTFIIYLFINPEQIAIPYDGSIEYQWLKILPYLFVIVAALAGTNVFLVLLIGSVLSGIIGLSIGSFDAWGMVNSIGNGIDSMSEIIIISILVGGMVEIIKYNGGIDFIIRVISKKTKTKKGAEYSLAFLTSVVNIFTANNTITILMVGPLAKDIAAEYGIPARRSASILDTFSCFMQGLLPYGAQLLAVIGLAGAIITPFGIMQFLFYPYLMGFISLLAITFGFPRLKG
ncbi:putative methionine transporter, NhaC family [Saccharicrinis carchari]|uniref:Putative methionine transporter, NhaC family n=1 Tax=Saccharicrinis carchari TaxID=1168039 RepID=A0A521D662_SACCC|nr:Na+/H+ antiporter NhaC family protein [Saccharicrinis carchari]SMO67157.1 putative methionine transporter, NhaC family [Saccharicrinis carchari]